MSTSAFNIQNFLSSELAETITYISVNSGFSTSANIQALVYRPTQQSFTVRQANNPIGTTNISIEISIDDIEKPNASRSNGDSVILYDQYNKLTTFTVNKIVNYDQFSKSWKLELS